MAKYIRILKRMIFPITILTILTVISIITTINAIYIALTNEDNAAIYVAVIIPITLLIIFLYIIDRLLIKKVSYVKLILGELIIGISVFFIFLYQNRTTDINFFTNQDYILLVFNSKEHSLSKFTKKKIFGKELNVYNTNIVYLDRNMALRKDLRVNTPKQWESFTQYRSKFKTEGDSIEYIFMSKNTSNIDYQLNSQFYVDSLLNSRK